MTNLGDATSFQCSRREVPFFPSAVPVRHRVTYWRCPDLLGKGASSDVFIASLDQIVSTMRHLLDVVLPAPAHGYPQALKAALAASIQTVLLHVDLEQGGVAASEPLVPTGLGTLG